MTVDVFIREQPDQLATGPRTLALFPGQGSQRPGMAAWITDYPVAEEVFRRADDILGIPLTQLCVDGTAEQLRATDVAQPAIVATSLALSAVRAQRGLPPAAVAGHSLGSSPPWLSPECSTRTPSCSWSAAAASSWPRSHAATTAR